MFTSRSHAARRPFRPGAAVRFAAVSLFALLASGAHAQAPAAPPTFLDRQLDRTDFAINGLGEFTNNTNGTNYLAQNLNLVTSNTLGALATLRFTRSPYLGVEANFGYARYTENYTLVNSASSPAGTTGLTLGIQTNAEEFSAGYVAKTRSQYFGVQPFASVGLGTMLFKPTSGGGQRLPNQYRAAYYYDVGAESLLFGSRYFGARAQFRQVFFFAPDFLTNYLTDKQRQITNEPSFGFYVKF